MMQSLTGIAGAGFDDPVTGQPMPNLSAIDTLALLGIVTPKLGSAIAKYNNQWNNADDGKSAIHSQFVDDDGILNIPIAATPDHYVNAKTYLSYIPDGDPFTFGMPWKRTPPQSTFESFEPYTKGSGSAVLQQVRQAISDWQDMVNASASCLSAASANTTAPANQDDLAQYMAALRRLCGDMDSVEENPPNDANVADALRYALAKSADYIGKAAAEISQEVGKDAGIVGANLTGGFLANAGILSFVVVGLVIHLYW
jgi:hypothetical protein